jgi:hypothetical protein
MTTTKPEDSPLDPYGLLEKGEALATEGELARLLGVPRMALAPLLRGPLYKLVRFVRTPPGGGSWRYSVADARVAIEPHRAAIEERRRQADERQAADRAAAAARKAARATSTAPKPSTGKAAPKAGSAKPAASKPAPKSGPPPAEVIARRRPGAA